MTWLEFLAQSALRGTVILAAAFLAAAVLRRGPAGLRHFMWTAALAALLALPLAMATFPRWERLRATGASAAAARSAGQFSAGQLSAGHVSVGQVLVVTGKRASQQR